MAALSFENAQTELNTILGDSANVTFTTAEKTRALTRAWNDSSVVSDVWDSSLTFTTGTYRYAQPSNVSAIQDIYVSATGASSPFPDPIDSGLWELVDGYIQFNSVADRAIPYGYTLYIKGHYKLTTDDDIEGVDLQEYVLALAGVETLKLLAYKKANLFTKNDVTMGELVTLRRELQQDVKELRTKLRRSWESA
jgi:hypothetical protein